MMALFSARTRSSNPVGGNDHAEALMKHSNSVSAGRYKPIKHPAPLVRGLDEPAVFDSALNRLFQACS